MDQLTKSEKMKFLEDRGWTPLWSDDNWISPELNERWKLKRDFNIDMAGVSLESAYSRTKYRLENPPPTQEQILDQITKMKNR